MSTTHGVAPFPLYWPLSHQRTKRRLDARFKVEFIPARDDLLRQLALLGTQDIVLSSNVPIRRDGLPEVPDREPEDPGVAVYFNRRQGRDGALRPFIIACDQFRKVRWNLRAIGATVEALRAIERHGATAMLEQAFSGFAALPPATPKKSWREVLGFTIEEFVTLDAARARVRELARLHHPDLGGNPEKMSEVNVALVDAVRELS